MKPTFVIYICAILFALTSCGQRTAKHDHGHEGDCSSHPHTHQAGDRHQEHFVVEGDSVVATEAAGHSHGHDCGHDHQH